MKIQPVGVLAPTWRGLTQEQVPRRFWSRLFGQKKKKKPVQPKEVKQPSAPESPPAKEKSDKA